MKSVHKFTFTHNGNLKIIRNNTIRTKVTHAKILYFRLLEGLLCMD